MLEALLKGLAIGLYLSVSVGPVIFAIIKTSIRYGRKAGYAFVAGVSASDIFMVLVGNLAAEMVQGLLKYKKELAIGGGILLIVMGLVTLILKKNPRPATITALPPSLITRVFSPSACRAFL